MKTAERLLPAARPYKLAADQGSAWAQGQLGLLYLSGHGGLPKDEREAARLFKLAAQQGDATGQNNLGFFYYEGRGGLPTNDREAARLYKLAADQGHAWAQANLGLFYENGLGGLPKDEREAARFYKLAADQGHARPQGGLGLCYRDSRGGRQNVGPDPTVAGAVQAKMASAAPSEAPLPAAEQPVANFGERNGYTVDKTADNNFRITDTNGNVVSTHPNLGEAFTARTRLINRQPAERPPAVPAEAMQDGRYGDTRPATVSVGQPKPRLTTTVLHRSPFAVLGATTRDDRRRIVELAEEKSLELDHDVCQKARSDLTNPRTRLNVETSWLPGVSPRKASQLLEGLLHGPMAAREESGLPTLAHLNLLAAAFEAVDGEHDAEDLAGFIQEVAYLAEDLYPEEVLRDINEDRAASGFPEVRTLDQIEAELTERKRSYRSTIKDALNRLPPTTLIQVMTETVDGVTAGGDDHAPGLIDDLVDSYEVETQGILQKEAENAHKLIEAARDSANSGEAAVKPYVDKLDAVARNWDKIAQPIQLSAKARGIDHAPSRDLAYEIRGLAIDLCNKHDMLTQSRRLTGLLQELFSEVPDVSERVKQDADALADIFHEREQAAARKDEWAREITYRAEIGLMFKKTLSISPEGISWKGHNFPLDSVTRVRWGSVRHSVNGIPTGTTYTIAFGDGRSEAVVELRKEDIYTMFLDKLWRAICVRLLGEILEALKAGHNLHFGGALLHDDGITLVKHKFLGANEKVRCSWSQVHVWSANGEFYIGSKDDKKTYAGISYIHGANTHILEQAIRMAFKKPGMRRLSDLLQ